MAPPLKPKMAKRAPMIAAAPAMIMPATMPILPSASPFDILSAPDQILTTPQRKPKRNITPSPYETEVMRLDGICAIVSADVAHARESSNASQSGPPRIKNLVFIETAKTLHEPLRENLGRFCHFSGRSCRHHLFGRKPEKLPALPVEMALVIETDLVSGLRHP